MNIIFIVVQLIFLAVALTIVCLERDDLVKMRKEVLYYSVIPSLFFSSSGHLLFGKRIREAMGWGNGVGVVTLERELGIMEFVMGVSATLTTSEPQYIGTLWGTMLIAMGINHILVTKRVSSVAVIDLVYGIA